MARASLAVAKDLGLGEETLRNWVKAAKAGKLKFHLGQDGDAEADGVLAASG